MPKLYPIVSIAAAVLILYSVTVVACQLAGGV